MYSNIEQIILASGSPRRKEFLDNLGLSFDVAPASIIEDKSESESAEKFVLRMAEEKAEAVAKQNPDKCIVSGDTIVCLDDQSVLGKPISKDHAVELLLSLSGREHVVRSAFCVLQKNRNIHRVSSHVTRVLFTDFTKDVARAYVETGEPMDKAGAYGIQGLGGGLVKRIEGSYSNVVGLPLAELIAVLMEEKIIRIRGC